GRAERGRVPPVVVRLGRAVGSRGRRTVAGEGLGDPVARAVAERHLLRPVARLLLTLDAGQGVQAGAVVPEDLGLRLVAHAVERYELLHRAREEPGGVGVVGRPGDVVVADRL